MLTTGIVLIAHGSPVAAANDELYALVDRVRERGGFPLVLPAFLEKTSPSIPEAIDEAVLQGATRVLLIPYFLLPGRHVSEDLPRFVALAKQSHPEAQIVLGDYLGYHNVLAEVVLDRIVEAVGEDE